VVGISTIRAEDAFAIGGRLGEISAPTLVIGGAATASTRPTCSGRRHPERTPHPLRGPHSRCTFADRRFGNDVLAFLLADQTDALRRGGRSVLTG
jgi:hypothetical protein